MQQIGLADLPAGKISGACAQGWEPLLEAFIENFRKRGEVGASFCVRIGGRPVIDVWGGTADLRTGEQWSADTLSVVFSATKGATALCAHLLAARGLLDLDAPVARYWPEFAANGKEHATVAMMLDHSVGVPGFREPLKDCAYADWEYMIRRLEQEPAFWQPGTRSGYHMLTFGWTVGEIVRRVSGKSLGRFFQDEIARPLGLDFWIGLPEALEHRVCPILPHTPGPDDPPPELMTYIMTHPGSDPFNVFVNTGGYIPSLTDPETGRSVVDTKLAHSAEIGAGGGITNARGLAGLYAPLANGGALWSPEDIWRMSQTASATGCDATLRVPTRFSLGFMKALDNRHRHSGDTASLIIGDRAFGHVGMGGSLGFADPDCRLSFGYTMNRMGPGIFLDERAQSLVDATYRKLGYASDRAGCWTRDAA